MKQPQDSHSRFRRKLNQNRKLKLLCSFNGAFQRRPPSGKLRYIGGETRFVSVDRTIGFANLRTKIADLCPGIRTSFSLRYHLYPETTPAVICSDCDVRCMVEEFEELETCGKNVRLWVFVSENRRDDVCDKMCVPYGNCVVNCAIDYVGIAIRSNKVRSGNFDDKNGDGSLRKRVLKQQLLSKQLDMMDKTDESESKCRNEDLITDQPLIDLRRQPKASMSQREDYAVNSSGYSGIGFEMHLQLQSNDPASFLPRRYNYGVIGKNAGTSSHFVSALQPARKRHSSCVLSVMDDCNAKHESRIIVRSALSILNKENSVPQPENSNLLKSSLAPSSGNLCDANTLCARKIVPGRNRTGIRSHIFVANDRRNEQGYHPYHLRTYQSQHAEINKPQIIQTDGRISGGKFHAGLRRNLNILKPGHSSKFSNFFWKPWHGIPDCVQCRDAIVMHSCHIKLDKVCSHTYTDPRYLGPNFRKCHLVSNGKYTCPESLFMSSESASRSPCANMTADSVDLTSSACQKLEVPIFSDNFHAACVGSGISLCSQNTDTSASHNAGTLVSSGHSCSNRIEKITNSKLSDAEQITYREQNSLSVTISTDHANLHAGISASLDHLSNLSLSPSTKGQLHPLSSNASSQMTIRNSGNTSPNAAKFEQKSNEREPIKNGFQSYSSTDGQMEGKESHPCSKVMSKRSCNSTAIYTHLATDGQMEGKESHPCSKVMSKRSCNSTTIYTHLATQGLQTIKSADLEYLKELGCGTYGTVFYGKWKGSDVAIKRIKPSCFSEGSVEQEKLVADFWREANILGHLHHPNVVALYGVVKDGPRMKLATVTEYMVNGSLKHFFRRKDRSIDRRKRLILATDAAIGMEYLHEKNIVHFDLKSHNLLVNMKDPKRPVCKIGDFGLSKIKQRTLVSGGVRGTIPWMAPELLNIKSNMVTEKVGQW